MFFSSPNIFVDGICFPTRFEICLILFPWHFMVESCKPNFTNSDLQIAASHANHERERESYMEKQCEHKYQTQ